MNDKKVPNHVGIIMDGNRRFAKRLMLEPWKGHEYGAEVLEKVLNWCNELGVKELTLYTFSVENFNRPKKEFDYLMQLFKKEFEKLMNDDRVDKRRIRIRFIGRLKMFDEELQNLMKKVMKRTKDYDDFRLNFAVAYGGRQEIVDGIRKVVELAKKGMINEEDVDEENFGNYLYLKSQPELVIRTGGEKRLSNFLMWQSAYSELMFIDNMWPEFSKEEFARCIEEYGNRERRFGR
ncbi:di-trans,poly-cis-decaprenylcistransferase [Candidatus Woesearchaeota archaeon]|nr:di-trans,poly-cis-decaprenylcistransferase [Candidatus Woesearchaeota archaeon]